MGGKGLARGSQEIEGEMGERRKDNHLSTEAAAAATLCNIHTVEFKNTV